MKVIYLAAGQSKRMGCKKMALHFGGEALGMRALKTILHNPKTYVYVVVHPQDNLDWISADVQQQLSAGRGELVVSEKAHLGQSCSLIAGVKKAEKPKADKVLICLADQPFIPKSMLQTLLCQSLEKDEKYIACLNNGVIKPPVVLSSLLFDRIYELTGDTGARTILKDSSLKGKLLEFIDDDFFADIDTMADYRNYCRVLEDRGADDEKFTTK
ncbi:NTP transferase domain-containing protein [Niallia sp. BSM11]|uniref:NTP transferase domain-containing protein n=1 Tax=Niallia sp. BSM11 TaxID=3391576 RepID=UPI003985546E